MRYSEVNDELDSLSSRALALADVVSGNKHVMRRGLDLSFTAVFETTAVSEGSPADGDSGGLGLRLPGGSRCSAVVGISCTYVQTGTVIEITTPEQCR